MLPTIKQIREANGGLDNLTDFEIAQHQHQQYKAYVPDFNRFAQMVGVDAGTKWGNRLGASIDSAQASLAGVGESALDIEGLRGVRLKNSLDARNSRQFARSQGAIMESGQVDGVGSALEYVGGLAVDTAPQMLSTLGAGALGTLAAGPVGGAAAAGSVGYSFALGDILENQREQTGGRTDVGSAAALAVPYALADTFTGAGGTLLKLSKGTLPKAGLNLLDKTLDGVQGIKGAALRTGVNVSKVSLAEGTGETFQEGMNQLGRMAVDPNETFLNDRSAEAFKESFIGGAALGGAIGGATGGWRRSDSYQPPIDENGGVNLLNGQPLNPPAPVVNPGANAPLADVINQRVGLDLNRQPTKGYESAFKAAQDEPSGVIAVDPATGQEYEMTQAQYLEREAAQRNDAFAQQLAAEQAALAEDKAKIEARSAVREEAKGLGITGSKGADLYLELKQALEDGVISEADFREARVQLGERKNNQVAKFIKAAYAQADATQTAKAEREAGALAAVQNPTPQASTMSQEEADAMAAEWEAAHAEQAALAAVQNPTPQASTMSQEEADAMAAEWARLTGQQGDVTDVQAREVQPTVGTPAVQRSRPPITQNTELRNWSTEPGAIAGIAPDKTTEVGRSGRKKDLTPAQVLEKIRKASPLNKKRILAVTGMDMVVDPTTGAPKLVISGNPMTLDEVADAESKDTGKKVSKQAISQTLADAGIDADVATRVASPDLPAVYSDADLEIAPSEDGGAKEGSGFRIESAASKATNQGVIYDEVRGSAHLNKIADLLLKGKITPEQVAQVTRYKSAAVQPTLSGVDTTTPVEMEQTAPTESKAATKNAVKTSEGKRVVKDLREDTTKIIAQRKRELLGHPEADNAAAMWDTARISWQDLPDALKADWIGMYVWNLDQNQRELDEGTLTRNQIEVERDFYDWQDYGGQQEQGGQPSLGWDAGAGGSSEVVDGTEAARPELPAPPAGPASEVVEADGAVQEVTAPRPYNVASLRGERGVLLEKFKAWAKNNPLRAPKADEVNATLNNTYARYKAKFPTENNQVAANAWAAEHGADIVAEWQTVIDTAMGVETVSPTETQEAATVEATLDVQEAAPADNTSAEDQRVAQENAAKAKVVVKKKRTVQKPVEAEPAVAERPRTQVTPVSAPTSMGSGHPDYEAKVNAPVQRALAEGNYTSITLKDGSPARLVELVDPTGEEGSIRAHAPEGGLIGELTFSKISPTEQPVVEVDEKFRRLGVATALYDTAEKTGWTAPDVKDTNAMRTEDGRAFREARAAASESILQRWFKSAAFKRWFGESKVVDGDGQPMVMYHGTSADITEFTPRQAGAIFVTSNPQFAAAFSGLSAARARASKRDGAENIIPVFVRAESPFDLDNKKQVAALRQHLSSDSVLDDAELKKHGVRDVETVIQFLMHGDRNDTRIWAVIEAPSVQAAIKEAGHDGFYVYENGEKNLGVYASTQLKSATGNNGQFDPNNPKILENLERLTSNTQPLVGESTRTPSVSRQVRTLLSKLDSGEISAEAFANRLEMAVNAADRAKDNKPVTDRVRGADYFRQKLLEAKRRGDLSEEAVDLAEWFIQGNPALLGDVGISVRSSKNDGVSGFYDTLRRVVSLVKESGNAETTVHELLHHFERMMPAPVQDAIRKSWLNSLAKGIATAKKSGNADLVAYYQHLSDFHLGEGAQSSLKAAQQLLKDGKVPYEHYANINASEFWAVNGSAIVAGRFKASQSVLGRLRNWLAELGQKIKAAFGLQSDAPIIRALDSLAKSDGKFVSASMLAKADSYNDVTQSVAQQLGPQYAKAETALTRAIGDLKTAAIKYGAFTRDLIDQAAKLMPAARKYLEHYEAVATDRTRMEQQVDAVLERFAALNTHERTRVNEVVRTSTMSKEWAFKPDWLPNAKYDENSDVARAFRALTPAQRGVIQDVFRHGHDTLAAMQKAVKDNVNSEFDVLIKGFRDAGNMDEATKAEARKAKALTEFSSMLEMNGNWPYAPLRRFGDHVVVAKSAAYRAAELADDKAQIKALEADENHYYVEFFESRGNARKAVDNMQATGKYDQVENFNKGNANEQLYGGRDVFNAFRRLRGLVNETGGASLSEPADATINKLMNDLYLSLLGERSARQAERNRKNTAGADRDMMRAFATKGRADAHFIASLRFGGQVQEDLLQMKREADEGHNGGTRELRREYFNEILARHAMQMDFQSTPVVDKVMATSSLWQLLFNPAYYLQNVMQPWVMSLPMLAGKHGYGKSWSALARAYRDLGPLIKDGNFSKGDYDALPADVRAIVKDLAARGRIEITLEHDLGQWNSNVDDGRVTRTWTKVTKGLSKVNSRLEMLNRLATGIAAARLEGVGNAKNATDYADRVIIGTHGDYNAFNAPRLMRTPLGRMATQFRKFQLIQITMYTKLVSDALKGASPTERAVARRVLAYNLGHMAALGGAMGLPGFQLFSMVLGSIFGDDDEPDDAEATLRRILGSGPLTDALTRGVPNMLGVDLSSKVGSGTMLSLFPYADWDIESRSGYQNLLAAAAGPFVGGLMPKWADAVGTATQGDYYKALEKVLPGAIGSAIKGTRFAVDGVTTTRGVQAMSADEITWVDGLFQAVGLPTSTITDRNFRSGAEYKASKFFDEKVSQVKKDYVEAFQDNDTDAMAEARQEWLDMQATRKRLGLTVQPLSQLIKAPRERMKRDRMAVGGVAADKETQGFVKNLME